MRKIFTIAAVAALAVSARGAETAKAKNTVPVSPETWIDADDYPPLALRAELQGTTGIELDVGADGQIKGCHVTLSSGHDVLDRATCRILIERAAFIPARDANDNAIESHFRRRVVWRLPENDATPLVDSGRRDSFTLYEDGSISDCTHETEGPAQGDATDLCQAKLRMPRQMVEALREGRSAGPVHVVMQTGLAVSDGAQEGHLKTPDGWERVGLVAATFEVGPDGGGRNCKIYESRGPDALFAPLCAAVIQGHYTPVKGKDDKVKLEGIGSSIVYFREKPKD
jgi:TonB family protein